MFFPLNLRQGIYFVFPNYVYLRPIIKYRTYHAHILMKKPRMDEKVLHF
jgi:hypothetical protein